jgi:hypothetical protein
MTIIVTIGVKTASKASPIIGTYCLRFGYPNSGLTVSLVGELGSNDTAKYFLYGTGDHIKSQRDSPAKEINLLNESENALFSNKSGRYTL